METFIAKITDLQQFNSTSASITWKDSKPDRWTNVYGKLEKGDNCIFLSESKLFVGDYSSTNSNISVTFNNIKSVNISTDDLLRIDVLNPETLAVIKRPPGPLLKTQINVNNVFNEAVAKNFISFYILRQGKESTLLPTLKTNDRVITIDQDNRLIELSIVVNGVLQAKSFGVDYFNAKDRTLKEILDLLKKIQKPNHVRNVQRIIETLSRNDYYKFPSFNDYYNINHNKGLYSHTSKSSITSTGVIDPVVGFNSEDDSGALSEMSKNIILYGPPGTGKTFHSISYAVSIIQGVSFKSLEEKSATKTGRKQIKDDYDKLVANGQIIFTTFHQSMGYEDFIEGIKPLPPGKDGIIKYDIVDGIFKELCSIAEDNWLSSKGTGVVVNSFEDVFEILKDEWEQNQKMKFDMVTPGKEFTLTGFTNKSIPFKKASGGESHSLSINTLRDIYYGKRDAKISGIGIYYPGVIKKLKGYKPLQKETISKRNYVVIIDEINRGNVSQIFGELITLIEKDKRLGEDEALTSTLPYSRDEFGVPPNVFIIGTMNTADRSVEALDTALRRRFSFVPIMSKPEELKEMIDGINLSEMLRVINRRLSILKDDDHTIGHAWLWDVKNIEQMKTVFANKILPLLQEYFYNDYEKLGLVLGDAFFEPHVHVSSSVFASFSGCNGLAGQYNQSWKYKLKSVDKLTISDFQTLAVNFYQEDTGEE